MEEDGTGIETDVRGSSLNRACRCVGSGSGRYGMEAVVIFSDSRRIKVGVALTQQNGYRNNE
jgi:hypothetical protein